MSKSTGVKARNVGLRSFLLILKAQGVVSGRGWSGGVNTGRRIGKDDLTLGLGQIGLRKNEGMGRPAGG